MFRHVVLWRFDDDTNPGHRRELAITVKAGLEELAFLGHGVLDIDVHIDPLPTAPGGADIMLTGAFASRDALKAYLEHPARLAIMKLAEENDVQLLCFDYLDDEQP